MIFNGLMDSTTYYWRIDAVNNNGTSTGYLWSFTSEIFQQELIACWPLNQGSNLLEIDATGNGNHIYLINRISENWVTGGMTGNVALEFDGVDDFLHVDNGKLIDFPIRDFTISFWMKQSEGNIKTPWITKGSFNGENWGPRYAIYNNSDRNVHFVVADAEHESVLEISNDNIVTGTWIMVTAVRDREEYNLKLYANTQPLSSEPDNTWNLSQDGDLYVGGDAEQTYFFSGLMDDIPIYNYPFDLVKIQNLYDETFTDIEMLEQAQFPKRLELVNFPNPFNNTTKILYTVIKKERVHLTIYNTLGQEVAMLVNEVKQRGKYICKFDEDYLTSGIYFSRLTNGGQVKIKKMILIK